MEKEKLLNLYHGEMKYKNGLHEIESSEELQKLAEEARKVFEGFLKDARALMTPERAAFVRQLRVDNDYTWRAVARDCRERFGGTWLPLSNQLAGMALCEVAAEYFGEHYKDKKWN